MKAAAASGPLASNQRCARGLLVLLALLGCASREARAGEPSWLKDALARPEPAAPPNAPAAVLFERTELELDATLGARIHECSAIRVLRSAGIDKVRYTVGLRPGGKLKSLRAWSIGPDGRRSVAGSKDVVENSYLPDEYTDTRRVSVRPPEVQVHDVVAVECTYEQPFPFPSWLWMPQFRGLAVGRSELSIKLPPGWRIESRAHGLAPQSLGTSGEAHGGEAHEFAVGPLPAPPDEVSSPPPDDWLARVRFRFVGPSGTHSFPDWQAVAHWYFRMSAPKFDAGQAPRDLMNRAASPDTVSAIAMLAREVQHAVSYAAIELGDQASIPDAAADTWQRRYGDCKDKATLLVATLLARGVVARPVLTCTRDERTVDPDSPDPGQFNHCIVAIRWPDAHPPAQASGPGPSGRVWTFFDPTSMAIPLGLLPPTDARAWGVIADTSEGLVRLPSDPEAIIRRHTRPRFLPKAPPERCSPMCSTSLTTAIGGSAPRACSKHPGLGRKSWGCAGWDSIQPVFPRWSRSRSGSLEQRTATAARGSCVLRSRLARRRRLRTRCGRCRSFWEDRHVMKTAWNSSCRTAITPRTFPRFTGRAPWENIVWRRSRGAVC